MDKTMPALIVGLPCMAGDGMRSWAVGAMHSCTREEAQEHALRENYRGRRKAAQTAGRHHALGPSSAGVSGLSRLE